MDETLYAEEPPTEKRVGPLTVRMRPRTLEAVGGQSYLLGPGAPLRWLVEGDAPLSVVLGGPPRTGRTTPAMVARSKNRS